jgi:hypothetical protein
MREGKDENMVDSILHNRLSSVIVAVLTAAFCLQFVIGESRPAHAQTSSHPPLVRFAWGITNFESMRVCMIGSGQAGRRVAEEVGVFWFFDQHNSELLRKEVRVLQGGFGCVDTTYEELVGAGVVPESTGRLQFGVAVPQPEWNTISIHTVDTTTGATVVTGPDVAGNFRDTAE